MLVRKFQRDLLFVGFVLQPYFNKKEIFFIRKSSSITNLAEGCYREAGSSNGELLMMVSFGRLMTPTAKDIFYAEGVL